MRGRRDTKPGSLLAAERHARADPLERGGVRVEQDVEPLFHSILVKIYHKHSFHLHLQTMYHLNIYHLLVIMSFYLN